YGGEIDKFIGDAVMATFGAPVAHADDPRRAVLAALDMQSAMSRFNAQLRRQIGCELEMRIGINTGVVLAGPIGSRRKRAFTVMGLEGSMGIGKSALVQALRRSAAARSAGWLNVACPPYGQDLPYTTLAGLLRGLLQRIERFESLELESILAASLDVEGLDVGLAAAV